MVLRPIYLISTLSMLEIGHSFERYALSVSIKPLNEVFRGKFDEYYHFLYHRGFWKIKIKNLKNTMSIEWTLLLKI